jgi:predicted ArsR family transcriptional regulator
MKTTRQRLIEALQSRRAASVNELGRSLQVTGADIRHHISILIKEGVVEIVAKQLKRDKGRPARLYGLTGQAILNNLDGLAGALLEELVENGKKTGEAVLMSQIASRLAGEKNPDPVSITQRFYLAIQHLNEMNYQSRWEAHAQAPRLILGHCPYAAILEQHPELCRMDALLIGEMLNSSATQTAKLERGPQGLPQCEFIVR